MAEEGQQGKILVFAEIKHGAVIIKINITDCFNILVGVPWFVL